MRADLSIRVFQPWLLVVGAFLMSAGLATGLIWRSELNDRTEARARAGDLAADHAQALQRGIELLRLSGPKFELAQADLEMARLVLGDPARQEQAGFVLKEARSIFEEAGAQLALRAVDALEAQLAASRGNQRS